MFSLLLKDLISDFHYLNIKKRYEVDRCIDIIIIIIIHSIIIVIKY